MNIGNLFNTYAENNTLNQENLPLALLILNLDYKHQNLPKTDLNFEQFTKLIQTLPQSNTAQPLHEIFLLLQENNKISKFALENFIKTNFKIEPNSLLASLPELISEDEFKAFFE